MKIYYFLIVIVYLVFAPFILAQTSTTININKDAAVYYRSGTTVMDNNYGSYVNLEVLTGTTNNVPTAWRSYIEIDLSGIPQNAVITEAILNLQVISSRQISGSNEVVLHKTSSSWIENSVTWNNQPTYVQDVADPIITSGGDGPRTLDLTGWVREALNNGESTISFVLKLVNEVPGQWIKMSFASSDNATVNYRPKLSVSYFSNDIFLRAQSEPINDIYDLRQGIINVQFDPEFVRDTENIFFEIKNRNNDIVVSKNSNIISLNYVFCKINSSGLPIVDDLIYELIFYNDKGQKRYLKFIK